MSSTSLLPNDDSLHDFYFSHSEAQDKATGCVGHLRGDFGSGKQFFTTWWPHQGDQLNTPAFKADIDRAVNWLREQPDSPLHDFDTMKRFCGRFERSWCHQGRYAPLLRLHGKNEAVCVYDPLYAGQGRLSVLYLLLSAESV